MARTRKLSKILGNIFIIAILLSLSNIYYIYLSTWSTHFMQSPILSFTLIVIFNINIFMLLWSFYRVVATDPGRVPIYWVLLLTRDSIWATLISKEEGIASCAMSLSLKDAIIALHAIDAS